MVWDTSVACEVQDFHILTLLVLASVCELGNFEYHGEVLCIVECGLPLHVFCCCLQLYKEMQIFECKHLSFGPALNCHLYVDHLAIQNKLIQLESSGTSVQNIVLEFDGNLGCSLVR